MDMRTENRKDGIMLIQRFTNTPAGASRMVFASHLALFQVY